MVLKFLDFILGQREPLTGPKPGVTVRWELWEAHCGHPVGVRFRGDETKGWKAAAETHEEMVGM